MDQGSSAGPIILWRNYIQAEQAFVASRLKLNQCISALPPLINQSLEHPGERSAALRLVEFLSKEGQYQVFDKLISLASYSNGFTHECRRLILSMPREWVLQNIEQRAVILLQSGDQEVYRAIFELYVELDVKLARMLTIDALRHSDPEVRKAGADFRRRLFITYNLQL